MLTPQVQQLTLPPLTHGGLQSSGALNFPEQYTKVSNVSRSAYLLQYAPPQSAGSGLGFASGVPANKENKTQFIDKKMSHEGGTAVSTPAGHLPAAVLHSSTTGVTTTSS